MGVGVALEDNFGGFLLCPFKSVTGLHSSGLLNIYMKLLEKIIRRYGLQCHQCADDTQLYPSFPLNSNDTVDVLNQCFDAVMGWSNVNFLKCIPDKTDILRVSRMVGQELQIFHVLEGNSLFQKPHSQLGVEN